jgi:hypothetical protein
MRAPLEHPQPPLLLISVVALFLLALLAAVVLSSRPAPAAPLDAEGLAIEAAIGEVCRERPDLPSCRAMGAR